MLSDAKVRSLKPKEKAYKVYDDRGLYMVVNPNGSRWWRFKYKYDGKERGISLGVYPDVTLQYAREQLQEARQLLARGIDPSAQRRTVKIARLDTFKPIAEEWLEMQAERLAPITMTKARWILGSFVYPRLGSRPIAEISAPEVLAVLRPIESRGMNETAHRALQRCGQIFRYAIATGRATRDITSDLRGALAPVVVENRAAITEPAKIGALLRAIDDYIGHPTTLMALKLSPLVFLRPSELRAAEWSEIDLQTEEWRVPAARMKMRERHIVPLASQAVAILRELRSVTGKGRYLFPSLRTSDRPMSVNTVNAALRRLGYARDEMTGHGFRAMACTCLNELGWHPDVIELQMAHAERNKVRAAYNRAERLADRRKMMQAWADYLDGLRSGERLSSPRDVQPPRPSADGKLRSRREIERKSRKSMDKQDDAVSQLELFSAQRT
ncbi:MAG: tyrosine-type recombinase/integrase [Steroidobacteraceae bacterium]